MKSYISKDYVRGNEQSIYLNKKMCLLREGSAIEFDSSKIDPSTITSVENGSVVFDSDLKKGVDDSKAINEKYNEMVKDVYDEMENVFGTRNDVSASAFAATYEAMLKRPENYIDALLGFSNEAEVTAYATSKIAASDGYGVFRLKRIAQYQAEKTAILGA